MKKAIKRTFAFVLVAIGFLIVSYVFYFYQPSQQTYVQSIENGVVLLSSYASSSSAPTFVQQTAFGGSTCPVGTDIPSCSSLNPTRYTQCSGGVTTQYQCPSGQLCQQGVGCRQPQCMPGTTQPYCSSVNPWGTNGYAQCSNGVVNQYRCSNPSAVCTPGVGCVVPQQQSSQVVSCPSDRQQPYCSSVDPSAIYECKVENNVLKTIKYVCRSGTCSNGRCVSQSSVSQSANCPPEQDGGIIDLPDAARGSNGILTVQCSRKVRYTKSGSICQQNSYCASYTTTCQNGYHISGSTTSSQSAASILECELNLPSSSGIVDGGVIPVSDGGNNTLFEGYACTGDVLFDCTDGHTITAMTCIDGTLVDTTETCSTENSIGAASGPTSPSSLTTSGASNINIQPQNSPDAIFGKNSSTLYIIGGVIASVGLFLVFIFRKKRR